MARIAGVDIPDKKRGEISLTYIYGIGRSTARKILKETGVDPNLKVESWNDEQITKIRNYISQNLKIEGELRSEVQLSIKRLMDIGCYRGIRHRSGLPVRGQRTRTMLEQEEERKKQ
jgi:small subunit ribosomal protein S13